MPDVEIDGHSVTVESGATLLDACRAAGVDVPTLCYGETLHPKNACRICVVELDGSRVLVPACSRQAEDGMVVRTQTDRTHARPQARARAARVDHRARLGAARRRRGSTSTAPLPHDSATTPRPCISPRRSTTTSTYATTAAASSVTSASTRAASSGRTRSPSPSPVAASTPTSPTEWDAALPDSACVYCGNCIAVCPTGALTPSTEFEMRHDGTWDEDAQTVTTTVCGYCGVGCNLELHVQDNRIVKVTSPEDHSITHGNLCIKGRFGFTHVQPD